MRRAGLPPAPDPAEFREPRRRDSASHCAVSVSAASPAILLACGSSLRQDDSVGLRIAEAAEKLLPASRLRIVAAQQFTPEMAAELAESDLAIFVDASAVDEPGAIRVEPVEARSESPESHNLNPSGLLALAQSLCGHCPAHAFELTVGASHFGYGEDLSGPLRQAVPKAVRLVSNLVGAFVKIA
jgi:hydrogenase maturation protease